MIRHAVTSSNIAEIGYDSDKKILEVKFVTGKVYQYFDVPEGVYSQINTAQSVGRTLNELIKKNNYGFKEV